MGIETALIVGALASAGGALYSGYSQKQAYDAQKKQANADAFAEQANGRLEAERIRKQAKQAKSSAVAAMAANGLNVEDGVSEVINDQISQDSEYDAFTAILSGKARSDKLRTDGYNYKIAGRNAMTTGVLNATAALAGSEGGAKAVGAVKNTFSSSTKGEPMARNNSALSRTSTNQPNGWKA